jgi:hypothetical protein
MGKVYLKTLDVLYVPSGQTPGVMSVELGYKKSGYPDRKRAEQNLACQLVEGNTFSLDPAHGIRLYLNIDLFAQKEGPSTAGL